MKIAFAVAALAGLIVPMSTAQAASAAPSDTPPAATAAPAAAPTGPVLVARWDFNAGGANGRVSDTSGHGGPMLSARAADNGILRYAPGPSGQYVAFPDLCAPNAATCPRALLEAPNSANLNPGVRPFRWSASMRVTKTQVRGSANIMQKGTSATGSQWKLQIGQKVGKAQCVVVGVGSPAVYIAHSSAPVTDGVWHKISCLRSGTSLSISVDGVQQGTTAVPATLNITNTMPLRLGGPNFNKTSDMYHGQLDDVYAELG